MDILNDFLAGSLGRGEFQARDCVWDAVRLPAVSVGDSQRQDECLSQEPFLEEPLCLTSEACCIDNFFKIVFYGCSPGVQFF